MKRFQLLFLSIISGFVCFAGTVNIIPRPQNVQPDKGYYTVDAITTIKAGKGTEKYAEYLSNILSTSTGFEINIVEESYAPPIIMSIDSVSGLPAEGYSLSVSPARVIIKGADEAGLMYGIQSFLQLLPPQIFSQRRENVAGWNAPSVEIIDAPAHPWRSMMLDVARYYHSPEYIKKFIDMMALYKFNKLQLHLTDDSGWRLESERFPLLTEKGAYAGTHEDRLGGYYTRDEMKDLIDYAQFRGVEIIPEIEFPAHMLSAIVAYPELSCRGVQLDLPRQHFISPDILCVGRDSSLRFIFDILDETIELFPSKYINIGGDEAIYDRWEECDYCQALKEREGLKETRELQGWLTDSVARYMANKGRTVIGWEEIITRGDVSTPVTALIWHEAADSMLVKPGNHKAILTPATHTYLDFPENDTPGEVKAATWMPPISTQKAYSLPVNDYSDNSSVIGIQGCLWSDQFIIGDKLQNIDPIGENRSSAYIDYLAFPRMMALAEVAWTQQDKRKWDDFQDRLTHQYAKLDNLGTGYRVPEPRFVSRTEMYDGNERIVLKPAVDGAEIRYTTDGTYPTRHSALYPSNGIVVKPGTEVKASTVTSNHRVSLPLTVK